MLYVANMFLATIQTVLNKNGEYWSQTRLTNIKS